MHLLITWQYLLLDLSPGSSPQTQAELLNVYFEFQWWNLQCVELINSHWCASSVFVSAAQKTQKKSRDGVCCCLKLQSDQINIIDNSWINVSKLNLYRRSKNCNLSNVQQGQQIVQRFMKGDWTSNLVHRLSKYFPDKFVLSLVSIL